MDTILTHEQRVWMVKMFPYLATPYRTVFITIYKAGKYNDEEKERMNFLIGVIKNNPSFFKSILTKEQL